jgi:hypothetical protein
MIYTEIWQDRKVATKGVRKRARDVEKYSILKNVLVPTLLNEASKPSVWKRLGALRAITAYIERSVRVPVKSCCNKLPTMNRYVEILTSTGMNSVRKSSP